MNLYFLHTQIKPVPYSIVSMIDSLDFWLNQQPFTIHIGILI